MAFSMPQDDEADADPAALIALWALRQGGMTYEAIAEDGQQGMTPLGVAALLAGFATMVDMGMSAPPGTADAVRDDLRKHGFAVDPIEALQAAYDEAHGVTATMH